MRVRTLIDLLSQVDPDLEVKVAADPEGNGFYSLGGIFDCYGVESPVDDWHHEDVHHMEEITEEEEGEHHLLPGYEQVLILWP